MAKTSKNTVALELWEKLTSSFENSRNFHAKKIFELGLTVPQFNVLNLLYTKGPLTLKKISEAMFVTGANITCVVDNLEKEDLVKRVFSSNDRRMIFAHLTPAGKDRIEKILPHFYDTIGKIFAKLNETEQKQLSKLLQKIENPE